MTPTRVRQAAQEQDGSLHFTLKLQSEEISAVLSEAVWESRYGPLQSDASLREIYLAHHPLIEAAVMRRLHDHKQQPVVLQSLDL